MNPSIPKIDLKVGGNATIPANAAFNTDAQPLSRSYEYNMVFVKNAVVGGNPILKIEVSNDDVNWINPYYDTINDNEITFELIDDVTTAFDSILPYRFVRVSGDPNGATGGDIGIQFVPVADA